MGFFFVVMIRLPLLRSSAMILLSDVTIVGGFCSSMTITAEQKARITSALRHPMEEETWRFLLARSLLGDDIDNCVRCWDSALCWTIIASHKIMYQQRLGLYVCIDPKNIYISCWSIRWCASHGAGTINERNTHRLQNFSERRSLNDFRAPIWLYGSSGFRSNRSICMFALSW